MAYGIKLVGAPLYLAYDRDKRCADLVPLIMAGTYSKDTADYQCRRSNESALYVGSDERFEVVSLPLDAALEGMLADMERGAA